MRSLAALILLLAAGAASADTCKYVDAEGRIIYSNVPIKNARKVSCFAPSAPPPAQAAPPPSQQKEETARETAKPRVDEATQKQRDAGRRSILEAELKAEEERLEAAKKDLAEQEATRMGDERNYQRVLDRLKPYQEAVEQHEKNVAALRQELATLR